MQLCYNWCEKQKLIVIVIVDPDNTQCLLDIQILFLFKIKMSEHP